MNGYGYRQRLDLPSRLTNEPESRIATPLRLEGRRVQRSVKDPPVGGASGESIWMLYASPEGGEAMLGRGDAGGSVFGPGGGGSSSQGYAWNDALKRYGSFNTVTGGSGYQTGFFEELVDPGTYVSPSSFGGADTQVIRVREVLSWSKAATGGYAICLFGIVLGGTTDNNVDDPGYIGFRNRLGSSELVAPWEIYFTNNDLSFIRRIDTAFDSSTPHELMLELDPVLREVRWWIDGELVDRYAPAAGEVPSSSQAKNFFHHVRAGDASATLWYGMGAGRRLITRGSSPFDEPIIGYGPDGAVFGNQDPINTTATETGIEPFAGLRWFYARRSGQTTDGYAQRRWTQWSAHQFIDPTTAAYPFKLELEDFFSVLNTSGNCRALFGFYHAVDESSDANHFDTVVGVGWKAGTDGVWTSFLRDAPGNTTPVRVIHETAHAGLLMTDAHRLGVRLDGSTKTITWLLDGVEVDSYTPTAPLDQTKGGTYLMYRVLVPASGDGKLRMHAGGNPAILRLVKTTAN